MLKGIDFFEIHGNGNIETTTAALTKFPLNPKSAENTPNLQFSGRNRGKITAIIHSTNREVIKRVMLQTELERR